jgi:hypothetical protein
MGRAELDDLHDGYRQYRADQSRAYSAVWSTSRMVFDQLAAGVA